MKIPLILLFTFFAFPSFSQTYIAKYKVSTSIGDDKTPVPTTLYLTYTVKCNNRYIDIVGAKDSMSVIYSSESPFGEHVIIDTKTKLVYYVNEKLMKRMEEYSLLKKKAVNVGEYEQNIIGKPDVTVIASKLIPKNITPGVLFQNLEDGIKKISAPKLYIELEGKVKKADNKMENYDNLFKGYEGKNLDIVSFF